MNRDELIIEIKKILEEELHAYLAPLEEKISPENKQKFKEAQNTVTNYVQENPLQSIGLAFLAGLFVTKIFRGSGKDS